ncbi:MAG: diflavin oxidoreductase, partial [Gammaproteobacteria bacterium]
MSEAGPGRPLRTETHPLLFSMTIVPTIPETAPFSAEQRAWLNGYFAGLFSRGEVQPHVAGRASAAPTLQSLTILFGSQTGTAETLAKRAAKEAGKRGFAATVLDMAQADLATMAAEKNLLLITSTYGDGEPPDNARNLHATLAGSSEFSVLKSVRYSVCALGDTNYVQFCKCGNDFDTFLEQRGATRVAPRVDCDLDYEAKFSNWLNGALGALAHGAAGAGPSPNSKSGALVADKPAAAGVTQVEPADGYSRSRPFSARVLTSRTLSGPGSGKQVHHVEIALDDSGLSYEAGDALGVYPHNCPELVDELLAVLECDGEEGVPAPDGSTVPLRRALAELYDLGRPTAELLDRFGSAGGGGTAVALHHVIDLLHARVDVKLPPVDFVRGLKRLQPRLYSISSSPRAHAGQVHLTVGALRYDAAGRTRKGVCSTFLADRVVHGESRAGIFVHSNPSFR